LIPHANVDGDQIGTVELGGRGCGDNRQLNRRGHLQNFTTKHTKSTKEGIQREGAKDAKAGFARIKTFESRAA
jgi:hypothetical protein